jgi:hypothetical protein
MDGRVVGRIPNEDDDILADDFSEKLGGPALGQVGVAEIGARENEAIALRPRIFGIDTTVQVHNAVQVVIS